MFKGPDFARYTIGQEDTVDEISDWLRGRYICATEAAWRIFGFHTYDRHPSVVCLPVHAEGADWVVFSEGDEQRALADSISQLQRYFHRPKREPWLALRYHEYFEQYVVTKSCAKTWQSSFPSLFPASTTDCADMVAPPVLDDAPQGKQFFVCPRVHGEPPLCRLQMKYPKQKESFYLRHILLNYAKASFLDCRTHNGRTYSTFEEAALQTGLFTRKDEATKVLEEMVQLHYTGAQLRFAFVLLVEQDARPKTLLAKFQKYLMKDFTDKGSKQRDAQEKLTLALRHLCSASPTALAALVLAPIPKEETRTATDSGHENEAALRRKQLEQDPKQTAALSAIQKALDSSQENFFFVNGRAGTGKTTLANFISHDCAAKGLSYLNCATTGQAALHLLNGRTAHAMVSLSTRKRRSLARFHQLAHTPTFSYVPESSNGVSSQ